MTERLKNERYESIVDAALTFFTILVGLKLADLIDDRKGTLGVDKWPCFIIGVAVFLRYVTGSFAHQRAQHVNQSEKHDVQFLVDFGFLITFGIIAVWACVADTVPEFLHRLIRFTGTAIAWTLGYFLFAFIARARRRPYTFKYVWWLALNIVQYFVFRQAKSIWPPTHPTISVLCFELPWLSVISAASVLLLLADLCLQLGFHKPRSHAASHGAHLS
jgi:hypothetical protein